MKHDKKSCAVCRAGIPHYPTPSNEAEREQRFHEFMKNMKRREYQRPFGSEPKAKLSAREPTPQMGLPGFGKVSGL